MKIHGLKFHNKLQTDPILSGKFNEWELRSWYAVTFFIDDDPDEKLIFVPKFYVTDYASIPKFAWSVVGGPATGRHKRGVIFHDWICSMHSAPQKFGDTLLLEIMKYDKTRLWKRRLIYWSVRIGGKIPWFRWKDKDKVNMYYKYRNAQLSEVKNLKGFTVYA